MGIAEIESAIARLPAGELAELITWLKRRYDQIWDSQIEDDLGAGRLDAIVAKAEDEYRQGLAELLSSTD